MRTRPTLPLWSGRRLGAAGALLAALVLAGCSGGSAEREAEPAPLSTAASAAATDGSSASADPSASPTEQVVTTMTTFRAPSNNIFCYLAPVEGQGAYARCDIAERSWTAPAPAAGCAGDWGGAADKRGSVGVGDQEASVLCATDSLVASDGEVLPYGSTIRMDDLVCTVSTETGVSCDNSRTGRGFSVSKAKVTLR